MTKPPILSRAAADAYEHLQHPVWVFSVRTLKILSVNSAAQDWVGYDAQTLRSKTIADLRPETDRAKILDKVQHFNGMNSYAGVWTIQAMNGDQYDAAFNWRKVIFDGAEAIVASIRDVTEINQTQARANALERESKSLRAQADLSTEHLSLLLDSLPGNILILTPDDYRVIAVSDEYARAVMLEREAILGRRFLDLFPDDPSEPEADGTRNLHASLQRVQALRVSDVMNLQRYPVQHPDGVFQERFWLLRNKPVLDTRGNIIYIVHRAEDLTSILSKAGPNLQPSLLNEQSNVMQLSDARAALVALQERDKRLKTAEMLLHLGSWEYDFERDVFNWSARVRDIYGQARAPKDFGEYLLLAPPEEREQLASQLTEFIDSNAPSIDFQHHVVRTDGAISYIRGVGTRHFVDGRDILIGIVQDITDLKAAEEELLRNVRRQRLAGRLARLGSWRVDLVVEQFLWDEETAAIHDEPEGISPPTLEDAIGYYVPEHRERISDRFEACASQGLPFDEVLQIETAKGRRVWVRALAEPIHNSIGEVVAVEGAFQDITELVGMRETAKETSHRLEQILEGMSDAFLLLDSQWRFSFINIQAEKLLHRRKEDLVGKNIWQEFPEASGGKFQREYERAVAEGKPVRFQEFYPPLNIWLEVSAEPTSHGLAVYFRDITKKRIRDEQLRLLEAAVSRQNDILLITEAEPITGPDGPRIVYVNDAFQRLTGFSSAEVIGKTPRILQGPKTQQQELDRIRRALEKWQPVRAELINYTKTGEEFWLELDIVPLADETGWFTHWVSIERDISERKNSELALRLNEERFSLVTKAAGSAIWEWDTATNEQWWSEGLRYIFGHIPDNMWSGPAPTVWSSHVHPEDAERVIEAFQRIKVGETSSVREQYRFERADGTWAFVEDRAFAQYDTDGSVMRILGSLTDITEQKQLEERFLQSQKMETVGQLTGGVAHDFNNLLMVILGNSEVLEDELVEQPHLQRLAKMSLSAAERGAELTKRLLAFSRKQALKPQVLNAAQLIQNMEDILRRTLPENINIEFVRSGGLWMVEVDAAQLESALLNLAVNARDAMLQGGFLTIEVANVMLDDDYVAAETDVPAGQYVMISVTDTGHGIIHENISRVFEPFFTTKEMGKGSGLGLSMVFGFVKQSKGHIRVYSEPDEGTSVKMYFPRTRTEEQHIVTSRAKSKLVGGAETILVVEDDSAVREHVVAQLRALGYQVLEASAGAEAIEILKQTSSIDLLFTDVVMPGGMGGKELADLARQLRPSLKVLYTSGYTENSIVHHGKLDPGVKLLNKPYRREQLAAKVREILEEGSREA
ncbi:PAS domain S-box protein [Sulfitobacter sp. 15WGC]|uniref:PAS domain S-box protein n=1 Tax=Sulfitobacter sp. 15WGC TaxID=2575437 RepID=UPI0010AC0C12|nr:PAS domain S-box protein [Sulfitobacter sp. 15WGC]TKA84389.1 PAS domain S-box protein [Sulfitobacter sp. 15WGC]